MMNSEESRSCALSYETFGECKHGDECQYRANIRPYCTRKAFATIALDTPELSGVVVFHPIEGDASSRRTYYVPKNKWFNLNAGKGDKVELQISEKRIKGGLRFARIVRVLCRPNIDMQSGRMFCFAHITYSDCSHGAECSLRHLRQDQALKQNFYVAQVLSLQSSLTDRGNCVLHVSQFHENSERVEKKYYLPVNDAWHSMKVTKGNLVIVQESELTVLDQKAEVLHYGKIAAILHETQSIEEVSIPIENHTRLGFVLEPSATNLRCFANSVDKCPCDKTCQRIGIHVVATALASQYKKLGPHFVPLERKTLKDLRISFRANVIRLAISLYVHSECNVVDGPIITPLLIPSGKIFPLDEQNDASNYSTYLETMWKVFGAQSFLKDVAKGPNASFMVDFPATWKVRYVLQKAKVFYSRYTMATLRSKQDSFVVVRNILTTIDIPRGDYMISMKPVEDLRAAWLHGNGCRELSLASVLSSAKRGVGTFWEDHFTGWYTKDVINGNEIPENKVAMSTLPSYVTSDLVNQQAVVTSLISPQMPLYLKSEVLGILVRRYETPTILKAVVRRILDNKVGLQVCGKYGRRYGNMVLALRDLFPGLSYGPSGSETDVTPKFDDADESADSFVFLLKKLFNGKYCNSKLVRLSGDKLLVVANSAIDVGVQAADTEEKIFELLEAECDSERPYESHVEGTKVTLRCGDELQLQIRNEDEFKGDMDSPIHLVKIGENCHLCLLHLNNPKRAFGSDRGDVRSLITKETLREMKRQVHENCLKFEVFEDVVITWHDDYFSGGEFVSTRDMVPRNLLCIRKEINKGGRNEPFIWNCHGVVSKVSGKKVEFSVCSLHQDQTAITWEGLDNRFIIEVIDIVENEDPIPTNETSS